MVGARGFEPLAIKKNQPQNLQYSSKCPSICPQENISDLNELISLWPSLPDKIKRVLLLLAREGGQDNE
jgi:hypothetical protein